MEKQGPVKEAARISENQKKVDEVSVEIGGIARRRETKSVSFAVFGALGENEEERVKENDEVVRSMRRKRRNTEKTFNSWWKKRQKMRKKRTPANAVSRRNRLRRRNRRWRWRWRQRWKNSLRGDVGFEKLVQIIQRKGR